MASKRKRPAILTDPEEGDEINVPSKSLTKKTKTTKRELLEPVNIALSKRKYDFYLEDQHPAITISTLYDSEIRAEFKAPIRADRGGEIIFNKACTKAVALWSVPVVLDLEANGVACTLHALDCLFAFNNQGTEIICCPSHNVIDASTGNVICNMGILEQGVDSVLFSGDDTKVLFSFVGKLVNGAWRNAFVECRNVTSPTTLWQYQSNRMGVGLGMAVSQLVACFPGSQHCVSPDWVSLMVWDYTNGEVVKSMPAKHGTTPLAVSFCGQEDLVCVVYDTGISMYNTTTETLLWKKKDLFHRVQTILFARMDQAIVIHFKIQPSNRYEQDTKVKVLDVANGGHLFTTNYSWFTQILGIGCPETESVVLL